MIQNDLAGSPHKCFKHSTGFFAKCYKRTYTNKRNAKEKIKASSKGVEESILIMAYINTLNTFLK